MIRFMPDGSLNRRKDYVVAGYTGISTNDEEIKLLFIIGQRFAVAELGIREARTDMDVLLKHPKLQTYITGTINKMKKKTSFAKSLYVFPEVNEALAAYI